jgi:hypothetical protein
MMFRRLLEQLLPPLPPQRDPVKVTVTPLPSPLPRLDEAQEAWLNHHATAYNPPDADDAISIANGER